MAIKLLNDEKLILNREVTAGQDVSAVAKLQHNYPALSDQAKMMLTGQFNIAQQHLYKAGSEPYNAAGELIDYSGEGNDAGLSGERSIIDDGSYYGGFSPDVNINSLVNNSDGFSIVFTTKGYVFFFDNYSTQDILFYYRGAYSQGWRVYIRGATTGVYNANIPIATLPYSADNSRTVFISYKKTEGLFLWIYEDGVMYSASDVTSTGTPDPASVYFYCLYNSGQQYNNFKIWDKMQSIDQMMANDMTDILVNFPLSGTLDEVSGSIYTGKCRSWITNSAQPYLFDDMDSIIWLNDGYNLKHGFRKISNDGGTTIVFQPRLYDDSGFPALPSGYSEISQHLAGTFHNQAETKITLQGYGAKTYDELKALAIIDNRFELVEDEDGNISELKVTKLTSTDTEHYTADNNNQQTLMESGNLTSPIDQTVKLLIQGGDNDNIAATKTITLPSGAEITVNAATSGEDGNNIQIVFVAGGTRGIAVVEGSTIFITLTYEAGDDLSDCTGELNSVDNLITYNIDVDGALSDDSGFLTGGFTPKLTISEVIFNNQSLFAMAINSSFLIIYIRQNAAYTQPTDAAEWAALLVTMTKLGAMELKETQLLINPETIEQDTGNKKAVLYKAVFQARDLNYTPETAAEYTASWENQEVDILIHDSTQGYAIMVPEIILHATEKANSGAVSYLELKAEKKGTTKENLRDIFNVPE